MLTIEHSDREREKAREVRREKENDRRGGGVTKMREEKRKEETYIEREMMR